MANQSKRRRTRQHYQDNPYRVNGSAAYQLDYDGSAARVRKPRPEPKAKPQVKPRRQPAPRPRVQVRPAGTVSVLAVLGFGAVAVCAALFLIANVRLMMLNDETVSLRNELESLQEEEATLQAQRDQSYDLDAIEETLTSSGTMVKPQPSQITYLITDQPDSVVKFEQPRQSLWDAIYEKLLEVSTTMFS